MAFGLSIPKQSNMSFKRQGIITLGRRSDAILHAKSLGRAFCTLRVCMLLVLTAKEAMLTQGNRPQGMIMLGCAKS